MKLEQNDIQSIINEFKSKSDPADRYTSFDFCYNYLRITTPSALLINFEKSCLTLGFYLASWGMLRGSSFLLEKSSKYYQSSIEYIACLDRKIWEIDVDNYNDETIALIIEIYSNIKDRIIENNNSDLILTTKILLGVFGFIPAFDQFFCNSFREIFNRQCGFRVVNKNSLTCIMDFYNANKGTIDILANDTLTTDFVTGKKTNLMYTKAKIIDMYGFTKGLK